MAQEYIEIRGARENNLKNVSLRIPKRKITIFTGVSGSGKSSIVFDTIASEAQRLLNENFSMFVRNFLPKYPTARGRRDRKSERSHGGRSKTTWWWLSFDTGHDHRYFNAAAAPLFTGGATANRQLQSFFV